MKDPGQGDFQVYTQAAHYIITVANSGPFFIPFMQRALPNFLMGPGLFYGFNNVWNNFRVNKKILGPGEFIVTITGPSRPEIIFRDNRKSLYVSYKVADPGFYVIDCKLNGQQIAGSPLQANITGQEAVASKVVATGDGLKFFRPGEVTKFRVNSSAAGNCFLDICVIGMPNHQVLMYTETDGIRVEYTPQYRGWYEIHIKLNGIHVPSSPFLAVLKREINVLPNEMVIFFGYVPDQWDGNDTENDNAMNNSNNQGFMEPIR